MLNQARHTASEPVSWLMSALALRRGAQILWAEVEPALAEVMPSEDKAAFLERARRLKSWPAYMLLMGLSLENLAKGVIVGREPERVGDSALTTWGSRGHDLVWLFERALIAVSVDEQALLERLTRFVAWRGRYPVPMQFDDFMQLVDFGEGRRLMTTGGIHRTDHLTFEALFTRVSGSDWDRL